MNNNFMQLSRFSTAWRICAVTALAVLGISLQNGYTLSKASLAAAAPDFGSNVLVIDPSTPVMLNLIQHLQP